MTRVYTARSHHGAHRPAVLDRPRVVQQQQKKKKKPYKIVLEAVTQEKRKLHSILTYASNAPPGFGFIPVGYPEFTEWCKEQCRQRNLDVHIVSAKPKNKAHADPEKISHHVHRIGHHFPNEIIEIACAKFGYSYDDVHGLRKTRHISNAETWMAQRMADYDQRLQLHGRPTTEKETKDHIRGSVREMFPKIPDADLTSIVDHAFEEGTNRVGNAKELSLARRVQLAVVAHIRHTYTDYDKILKTGSWTEARQKVEHVSLAKLKEWRDELGEQSNEMEDTFREVIVLDDDESSDEDTLSGADEREASMEIVSSRATARELLPEEMPYIQQQHAHDLGRAPRRTIVLRPMPVSRSTLSGPLDTHTSSQFSQAHTRPLPPSHLAHSRPMDPRTVHRAPQAVHNPAPLQMRDANGRLYNLQPIEDHREPTRLAEANGYSRVEYDPPFTTASRHAQEGYVQPHQSVNSFEHYHNRRPPPPPVSRRTSEQDVVLPSIEREPEHIPSPRRAPSSGFTELQSPKRKDFAPVTYSVDDRHSEQAPKRLKAMYYEPMDAYNRSRQQRSHEVVDLISSPYRPPYSGDRDVFVPMRPYTTTTTNSHSHVPAPPRDARGVYREVPTREPPSHAYIPEDEMYQRRVIPPRDYILREEPPRPRAAVDYGGHRLH